MNYYSEFFQKSKVKKLPIKIKDVISLRRKCSL